MTSHEHLLACLAEECAEVQQHVCKALRFGIEDKDPTIPDAKMEFRLIHEELQDVFAIVEMLGEDGLIPRNVDRPAIVEKKGKVRKFMEYARERGALS